MFIKIYKSMIFFALGIVADSPQAASKVSRRGL